MAEGVLPVCLGQATRVVEYLMDAHKTYVGRIRFGRTTDTYDADGRIMSESEVSGLTQEAVAEALPAFMGEIEQRPPPFSALKREGVPLYRLARAGEAVETSPRRVAVYRLELLAWEPPVATIEVECGKGTYIRSLAHDLGEALGVGGVLERLMRTSVGPFDLARAVTLEALRSEFEAGTWEERLIALDEVMLGWPAAILAEESARRVLTGRNPLGEVDDSPLPLVRAYSLGGDFIAVLRIEAGQMVPAKVFPPA
jgi:tRNA pseudouridine55 synthase